MNGGEERTLSDIRAVAEALADVLTERGLVVSAGPASPARVLDAAQVAVLLGRERHWVYEHAGELGAFRYGDGPRARLGFDLLAVERWMRERQIRGPAQPASGRRRRQRRLVNVADPIRYDAPSSGGYDHGT